MSMLFLRFFHWRQALTSVPFGAPFGHSRSQWAARRAVQPLDLHRRSVPLLLAVFLAVPLLAASSGGTIRGTVTDALGAPVAAARVALLLNGAVLNQARTGKQGAFSFTISARGRYEVRAGAKGLTTETSSPVILKPGETVRLRLRLQVGPLRQQLVVSATGEATPESQVGASVSVLSRKELDALNPLAVLDALRLVPGVQVVEEGQRGGVTSLFVRGGDSDFNKVLVDGISVNDVGGAFYFSSLAASGVDHIEVFRGPDSILYGSDALASVISITTRKGSTRVPEFTYSADDGSFHTLRQEASVGGAFNRFDYYSDFMRFDTQNSLPNNSFHDGTYNGNFGWTPSLNTRVRLTVHHDATGLGLSGPLNFYDIPDDSFQRQQDTYVGLTLQNQTTSRWHNTLRVTSARRHYFENSPAPIGTPSNPFGFGTDYLGNRVSLCGANGYCTTGEAILDYGGAYPLLYDSRTNIRSFDGQTDYLFGPRLGITGGFNYIHENGFTQSSGLPRSATTRDNYDFFLEARGSLWQRAFATAGVGFEKNAVFGFAATPRISLAYYLRRPSSSSLFGRTKLRFNFGTGILEPSILEQGSSLSSVLSAVQGGPELVRRYGISPVGAERSRSFDVGFDQGLWHERALLGLSYFHQEFYDLIDFVPQTALPDLGVPAEVVAQIPYSAGGAYINSDSFRSQGLETDFQARLRQNLMFEAQYTYLDAVVTQSFASSALSPAVNPAFPGVLIGAYAPLVGNRPFRRPAQTGSFVVIYSRPRFGFSFNGYAVGRSDDSTYLSDPFFGNSMLLPNHNLLAGYQLVGFTGWYKVHRHATLYTSMGNLLDEHYQAVFGYPALPFTFRAGVRFTLGGGDRW
ncbi:MAG: TonB-dependent receptor [Terriglobia bacterium]